MSIAIQTKRIGPRQRTFARGSEPLRSISWVRSPEPDAGMTLDEDIPADRLLAIIQMQNAIVRSRSDIHSVMSVVVDHAQRLTRATGAVIELVEADAMVYRAASGCAAPFVGLRLLRATTLSGQCVEGGVALHAADAATDDRVDRSACALVGAASIVVVPLMHRDEPVGVLKVIGDRPHMFDHATIKLLTMLADVIAASMQHAREHQEAVEMSFHDSLTGLYNRRAFDRQLAQELSRSKRSGHELSIVMFDLDGLKSANDTLGHAAGDQILRDAAAILRGALRVPDTCFRLGGDEFAAILPETGATGAAVAAERCVAAIAAANLGRPTIRVGVSAGVAQLGDGEPIADFVTRADAALYEHKRSKQR